MEKQAVKSRRDYLNVILCVLDGYDNFDLKVLHSCDAEINPFVMVEIQMDSFSSEFLKRIPVVYEVIGMAHLAMVRFELPFDCSALR